MCLCLDNEGVNDVASASGIVSVGEAHEGVMSKTGRMIIATEG
jgi:hypothetical protein